MKKYVTSLLVLMVLIPYSVFSQTRKETTVKLEWQEQTFFHFYSTDYSVYVSKPDFLNIQNDLLIGLFDEFAEQKDSINLADPFSNFKNEYQNVLWDQLIDCASMGHMLIHPVNSAKRLKTVLIIDDKSIQGSTGSIWECRDPKTNQVIFAHSIASVGVPRL